jgi:heparosan-N-sulfate-glucuronate 5-epimerase
MPTWRYYRRLLPAYLGRGRSQLTFWHDTPTLNPRAFPDNGATGVPARQSDAGNPTSAPGHLGPYYMLFREKADYPGPFDPAGIPLLDYHGAIGLQYNPIAIAQWGLANYNLFAETNDPSRREKTLKAADWLVSNLERNAHGLWVWNHHFDWEYRDTLKAPWYSGLAQGQGVSLLIRAHAVTRDEKYREAADRAFLALTKPIADGGVLCEDAAGNCWIEEYLVDPPTHILNGFIWALWGVYDYWLARSDATARQVFDRGVQTLVRNLPRYDTGYWSLYELSDGQPSNGKPSNGKPSNVHSSDRQPSNHQPKTRIKMLASPFYHRLHIVQLQVMARLTGDPIFTTYADRWQSYANRRVNRARALVEKSIFKLLYY